MVPSTLLCKLRFNLKPNQKQSKWVAVYFYFIVTVIMAIVELITQAAGLYCEWSFKPSFAHFWVVIIQNVVLPVGVLAVVQFYIRMNMEPHVKAHHPTLKILAFKGILLLNFLQSVGCPLVISTPTNTYRSYSRS